MAGFLRRLVNVAVSADQAADELAGGRLGETISGSCGRAIGVGPYGRTRWWGPLAVRLVDGIFGDGHCAGEALKEAKRRAAQEAGLIP